MNYKETMDYIINTAKFGSNYGLSRTEKILELLGNPHKKIKCIHVAGTNGKGSATAIIANVLKEAGYKVGMYTSPFLEVFEERIQINSENIAKEDLCQVVTELSKAVDKVIEMGYEHPTEFEIITCAAFLYFYNQKVDYAVIEVGLGGRLDSTNVITPLVCVITSISYDHMNILGNSLTSIASEKAGIIKEGVPVVLYPQARECEAVIEAVCKEKNSKLIRVKKDSAKLLLLGEEKFQHLSAQNYYQHVLINTEKNTYDVNLALLGKHQLLNCATAINCIEELINLGLKISNDNISKALKTVKWKGRIEVMSEKPLVVIDGAHNIDGITNLKESVEQYFKYKKLVLILGILADKEVQKMVRIIAPIAAKVITVTPHSNRAELSKDLEKVVLKINKNCESIEEYSEAYAKGLSYCGEEDILLISGSLHMIGDMRKIISSSHS